MKKAFSVSTIIWITLSTVFLLSCTKKGPPGDAPSALSVYPKSEDVRYHHESGVWQVQYNVQIEYPAEDILRFIRGSLEGQGWQPLNEDVLNPGLPTSHVNGWQQYTDGRTSPKAEVRQWLGQWKNPSGDVVWYRLQYRYEEATMPNLKTIEIIASYFPANVVQQQMKAARP